MQEARAGPCVVVSCHLEALWRQPPLLDAHFTNGIGGLVGASAAIATAISVSGDFLH